MAEVEAETNAKPKKKKRFASHINKQKFSHLKTRIRGIQLSYEFIDRVRWVLFVLAFILIYLAFQVGDDWFVREFANYDWARSIGF